jgi:hypothetical protein
VHLEVGVPPELADLDEGTPVHKGETLFGAAVCTALPRGDDQGLDSLL